MEGEVTEEVRGLKENDRQSALLKRMMARKMTGVHRGHPQEAILCALDECMQIEAELMAALAENKKLKEILAKIDGGNHVV